MMATNILLVQFSYLTLITETKEVVEKLLKNKYHFLVLQLAISDLLALVLIYYNVIEYF